MNKKRELPPCVMTVMDIQQLPRRSASLRIMLRHTAALMILLELKHKAMLVSYLNRAFANVVASHYTRFQVEKR